MLVVDLSKIFLITKIIQTITDYNLGTTVMIQDLFSPHNNSTILRLESVVSSIRKMFGEGGRETEEKPRFSQLKMLILQTNWNFSNQVALRITFAEFSDQQNYFDFKEITTPHLSAP